MPGIYSAHDAIIGVQGALGGRGGGGVRYLFAVTSDTHLYYPAAGGLERTQDIFAQIGGKRASFVMVNGDFVDGGTDALGATEEAEVAAILDQVSMPCYFGMGNHDNGTGNSTTDTTPESIAAFYALVADAQTTYPSGATDTGYYHFVSNDIDYIVLNSIEIQAPTEGDYGMGDTQRAWLDTTLDGITGSDKRLVVFCHVDPSSSGDAWYRLRSADRNYVQGALRKWSYLSGGILLAVITGHEHGLNNSSENRSRTTLDVVYWNLIDGLSTGGASNIKPLSYASGAKKHWWLGKLDGNTFSLLGQNGASDLSRTISVVSAPAAQSFNGTNEYHNTGIIPNATTEMKIVGNYRSLDATFRVHGTSSTTGQERYYCGINNGKWFLGYNDAQDSGIAADTSVHEFKITPDGLYLDGILIHANSTGALDNHDIITPIMLCCHKNLNGFCNFNLLRAEITHNGYRYFYFPTLSIP